MWPWFLAAAVAGYLALVPGVPIASLLGVASEAMVIGLAAFAFVNLGLALWAARPQDRLQAASN